MNRTLLDKARSMMNHAGLKKRILGRGNKTRGRLAHSHVHTRIEIKDPIEALLGTVPNIVRFRIFGCAAYPHIHKVNHAGKFIAHAEKEIYLGDENEAYREYSSKHR